MSSERHRVRSAGASDSGASALEFAIIAPVLMLLLFGLIEFGFVFQGQLAVTHAAREGARIAAVNKWDGAIVESRAYPLTTSSGLSISRQDLGESIRVTVTYPYQPRILTALPVMNLASSAQMRKEF